MKAMDFRLYRVFIAILLILVASGQAVGRTKESPYEMVMRLRQEAAAKKPEAPPGSGARHAAQAGSIVARAELKLVPPFQSVRRRASDSSDRIRQR